MAKAYLIGGPPRVGKSTLTMRLLRSTAAYATSTDALTDVVRRFADRQALPDVFHDSRGDSPGEAVAWQGKENAIVWQAADDFINRHIANGFDVVVEGLCVMPGFARKLKHDYKAVFLGNQAEAHFETIKRSAQNNSQDWLNKYDNKVIHDICLFGQAYSRYLEREAGLYHLPYIEMKDTDYTASLDTALAELLA